METNAQPAPSPIPGFRMPVRQQLAYALAMLDVPCPRIEPTATGAHLTLTFSESDAEALAVALLVAARNQGG